MDGEITLLHDRLKVLGVTPEGYIVGSPSITCRKHNNRSTECFDTGAMEPQAIFIRGADRKNVVDGTFLDPSGTRELYVYSGPYSYVGTMGSKVTVHSFRRIQEDKVNISLRGLGAGYDPNEELFAKLRLWKQLDTLLRRPSDERVRP